MDKIKQKALEVLETLGKKVHNDCDPCLGVITIVVVILFVTVIA